jgi:hypothetical protein
VAVGRAARAALLGVALASLGPVGCGFDVERPPADLPTLVALAPEGYEPEDAGEPPATICPETGYSGGEAPAVPDDLGAPATAGFRSADGAQLQVWAWWAGSAGAAAGYVEEAVAGRDGCDYDIHYDSDTDGDGRLDAGGSQTQTAEEWSDEHWFGLAASGHSSGDGYVATQSRFVRSGAVVLLAVLTGHETDDLETVLDAYLHTVGAGLG